MRYFVELKNEETFHKFIAPTAIIPYNAEDIVEATETALQIIRRLRARRLTAERKSWAVRITNDNGKIVLLITNEM